MEIKRAEWPADLPSRGKYNELYEELSSLRVGETVTVTFDDRAELDRIKSALYQRNNRAGIEMKFKSAARREAGEERGLLFLKRTE